MLGTYCYSFLPERVDNRTDAEEPTQSSGSTRRATTEDR